MGCLTVTEVGPAAREALWRTIEDTQREDRLAPVTVAVPSPYAGLSLRHELAGRGGLVNVGFVSLNRVAELLGAPSLGDGRRPLSAPVATEVTRLAIARTGTFDSSARTVDAVNATLREAIRSGITPIGELGDVYASGRVLLRDHYDDEDQLHAAARVVEEGAAGLDDLGTVVWYLPERITPGSAALVSALARVGRLRVIAAALGDAAADRVLDDLAVTLDHRDALGHLRTDAPAPTCTEILVAPDHDTEVRAVASRVLVAADTGVPFHRIAVTFTRPEPYQRLVHARFGAAGIPVAGPASRRLSETAAGRVLRGLLHAIDEQLSRDAVLDLLTVAPLRPDLADARLVARWDAASRRAGVVSGLREWEARLDAWRTRRALPDGGDGGDDEVDALGAVVRALAPPSNGWSGRAAHSDHVLDLLLGSGTHLPADERDALAEVRGVLGALAGLAELGGDGGAFPDALRAALDAPGGRVGTVGTGVLVVPMASLAGTASDVVFVLGLDEDAMGGPAIDDPLLPGHGLPRARRDRRRGAYLAALASAPRRVLSLPRADLRAERAVTPSPWVMESATVLAGRPVSASELLGNTSHSWLVTIPSFVELVAAGPSARDEARLAALLGWRAAGGAPSELPRDDPVLALGFQASTARAGPRAGAWDGVVGQLPDLAPDDEHPLSATRLETWAICPFRYFVRSVLGVDELEKPEVLERIEPRVRGMLVHEALREFLAAHPAKPPDELWSQHERAELVDVVERLADDAAARGLVGRALLWAIDRRRILADARAFLDVDEHLRGERGVAPWLQEVGFGDREDDELAPLDLDVGARSVRFRGRIDRVDRSPDGTRLEVYDYKTGRPASGQLTDDAVAGGTLLQPVLYAMVMRREAPHAAVGSHLWYTHAADGNTLDGLNVVDDRAVDRLVDALEGVIGAIARGVFPRDPGEDSFFGPEHCKYCEVDRACPSDRVRTAEERAGVDPAFDPLHGLRAGGETDDEGERS